jgi:hypothetical protein
MEEEQADINSGHTSRRVYRQRASSPDEKEQAVETQVDLRKQKQAQPLSRVDILDFKRADILAYYHIKEEMH